MAWEQQPQNTIIYKAVQRFSFSSPPSPFLRLFALHLDIHRGIETSEEIPLYLLNPPNSPQPYDTRAKPRDKLGDDKTR